jgi:hypothetical protein
MTPFSRFPAGARPPKLAVVRTVRFLFVASWLAWLAPPAPAATPAAARIVKVLPHHLDWEGRHTLSPSLYERDAYQAQLRKQPALCSGMRFDVQWKARDARGCRLRIELRGVKNKQPTSAMLEETRLKRGFLSSWTTLKLEGDAWRAFGELTAWRATLWQDDRLVAEQKSFLW